MALLRIDGKTFDTDQVLIELDRADCAESLAAFVKLAWHLIEPGQPYIHGWHIDALCMHLEAIGHEVQFEDGTYYNRLLANIPPGTMKSLLVSVFFPAWEWGPLNKPHLRYLCVSHSMDNAIRDNMRMRRLVMSDWYQKRWPHVRLVDDQNAKTKFETSAMGFREASSTTGMTGRRADRVIIDDPHSVDGANSDAMRASTIDWFLNAAQSRINNPTKSAIIVIMQRLHEEDVSGIILDREMGYDHLCLPMRATLWRKDFPTMLGFVDPRTEEGELLFPERFPEEYVSGQERTMSPFAVSGQFQQEPVPDGGGIIKSDWWQRWDGDKYPAMSYIIASLDTAYTIKQENDYSALTIWGVFSGEMIEGEITGYQSAQGKRKDRNETVIQFDEAAKVRNLGGPDEGGNRPSVMLMYAWQERLEFHDLIEKVVDSCRKFKVDRLLIESKASGLSVSQELRRSFNRENFGIQMINPGQLDKAARLHSVAHIFSERMVWAPDRAFADMVIQQTSVFPKGKHDDLVDSLSQGMKHLRDIGLLTRQVEWTYDAEQAVQHRGKPPAPLYQV